LSNLKGYSAQPSGVPPLEYLNRREDSPPPKIKLKKCKEALPHDGRGMLALTRRNLETICIPDLNITFTFELPLNTTKIRVYIQAPKEIKVVRGELL
jgi:hypothetical protein